MFVVAAKVGEGRIGAANRKRNGRTAQRYHADYARHVINKFDRSAGQIVAIVRARAYARIKAHGILLLSLGAAVTVNFVKVLLPRSAYETRSKKKSIKIKRIYKGMIFITTRYPFLYFTY